MNLDLSEKQTAWLATLKTYLTSWYRADATAPFDAVLWNGLQEHGYFGTGKKAPYEALEAVFLTEEVSRLNGMSPVGVQAMITAPLMADHRHEALAVCRQGEHVPVRYAGFAPLLAVIGEDVAKVYRVDPAKAVAVKSNFVYPLATPAAVSGDVIAILPADLVTRRWQISIGAEIVGAMEGAIAHLTSHLATREQFGKALGSFQAIQHRVSELAVSLECARYLVRHAAWHDSNEFAATAAAYAATAAHTLCLDAHQLSGAQGFTLESGLYRWTLRLQMLSLEAGGVAGHAAGAADLLWSDALPLVSNKRSSTTG
ncbi:MULTISPECIES: acyl-CoA dehydrogenase family protein [unclassified Pseudomonas]|uniref:acyl-CoA dehydrogenase family protein n=1 Tax=unclassified Pseudomonas TaxID=196821 RepID=UPI0039B73411